jgi:hypothetical protein
VAEAAPELPPFLRRYPTAVINYRWAGFHPYPDSEPASPPNLSTGEGAGTEQGGFSPIPRWPFPVHDTLQGYSWIVKNFGPTTHTRRDVYVYGSYLGASLATSMALTESHPHQRMAVRGCVAYNGIYNWTMFLPDHQVNKKSGVRAANVLEEILGQPTDPAFHELRQHMPGLFGDPSHLFDSFASPCLFFQTPGLLVPEGFDVSADPVIAMLGPTARQESDDAQAAIRELLGAMQDKASRRSALAFPPRKSTLKLPEMLLLHTPAPTPLLRRRRWQRRPTRRKRTPASNDFGTQAEELAALMRRSLEKLELRERARWDDGFDSFDEIQRRVQIQDVGEDETLWELPSRGEAVALDWLEERMVGKL